MSLRRLLALVAAAALALVLAPAPASASVCYDAIAQTHPSQCYKFRNETVADRPALCVWCNTIGFAGLPVGSCHPRDQYAFLRNAGVCNSTLVERLLSHAPHSALVLPVAGLRAK